ncbi:right-handed parallel beta-helix repeat-containing protein [Paenibacillus sp. CAU 1782]
MQLTPNLNLKKPEASDAVNIEDLNGNADILDNAVSGLTTSLSNKVDKASGKDLSTNDYTTAEKTKLAGIAAGANNYTHPSTHPPSVIAQDASNRFVTDAEKTAWNAKAGTAVATTSANGLMSAADKSALSAATNAATASTLVKRDAAGRMKAAAPAAGDDVARKVEIDNLKSYLENEAKKNSFVFNVKNYGVNNNGAAIQAALNAAEEAGAGTVFLPPGVYDIDSDVLKVASGIKIVGPGATLKRMANIPAILINKSDGSTGGFTATQNVEISGITFDGNNVMYPSNVTLLALGHANNIQISNCIFENCSTWNLLVLNGCKDVSIQGSIFRNYTGSTTMVQLGYAGGVTEFPWFGPYDESSCYNITVKKCTFLGDSPSNRHAIGNYSFKPGISTLDIYIIECRFNRFFRTIVLGDTSCLFVKNNIFESCSAGVLFIERENDVKSWCITGNKFYASYTNGIEERFFYGQNTSLNKKFSGIEIRQNEIDNCYTHGIAFTATGDVIIEDNIITNCGRNAIYLYGMNYANVKGNITRNNNRNFSGADILIGNNTSLATSNVIVEGNNIERYITSINTSNVLVSNNIISVSITNNPNNSGIHRNNVVSGLWVT